ncbi:MAG: 3' terminal RNA ribose 2'-O-methyltransferase Hen1 [Planctomycetia bacterium]|nr:3' terminal RNA ribose 2'-O-methyltransferase Hen1 [Planctomycetia bacterium]
MLLTISTTHAPATDLGYLLHKHPGRCQSFDLSFGRAHVFYPRAAEEDCSACLLLDVDPVGLVRGKGNFRGGLLDQYVNDRPFVASSFMSVAIAQVFGSALQGNCKDRPDVAAAAIPLVASIDVLPVRGGEEFLRKLFEPLGYTVSVVRHPLDEQFPEWGESAYYSVTIEKTTRLSELLAHLYVLIPVFDHQKHYFVGADEVEKLLAKGEGWLAGHPARDTIVRRYLKWKPTLASDALARLIEEDAVEPDAVDPQSEPGEGFDGVPGATPQQSSLDATGALPQAPSELEQSPQQLTLHQQRLGAVLSVLRASGARKVLDLGCGEGKLLRELLADRQFEEIAGLDVSVRSLEIAHRRLRLDNLSPAVRDKIKLIHGSLTYRDRRLEGFDAAAIVEVIEHLDPPRLTAFQRVVFECAKPKIVIVTTPNREYNVLWESLPAGSVRHADHRFEWTRAEFQDWACAVAERHGYTVKFLPIGPEDPTLGPPTQLGLFEKAGAKEASSG